MDEKRFYMVGVIHGDRSAKGRLKEIIRAIDPDMITVEFTNYGLNFRRNNSKYLKRRIKRIARLLKIRSESLSNIRNFLDLPYEYLVAREYAKKKGIPLYLVDMDFFSFFRLRYAQDLFKEENLKKMAEEKRLHGLDIERRIADMYFHKNRKLFSPSQEMRIRDEYAFRLISKLLEANGGKLLHICGWQHLVDEYGYFSRLNPQKIYIYDKAFGL